MGGFLARSLSLPDNELYTNQGDNKVRQERKRRRSADLGSGIELIFHLMDQHTESMLTLLLLLLYIYRYIYLYMD